MILIFQSIVCHPRSHLFRTFTTASNTLPLFGQELSLLVFVFGRLTCCQGYFWLCLQTLVAAPVKGIWVFYLTSCYKKHALWFQFWPTCSLFWSSVNSLILALICSPNISSWVGGGAISSLFNIDSSSASLKVLNSTGSCEKRLWYWWLLQVTSRSF